MRHKAIIIPIAMITLLAFGVVSPASAFVDPATITVILGLGFLTFYATSKTVENKKTEDALAKAQKQLNAQKEPQQAGTAALHADPGPHAGLSN